MRVTIADVLDAGGEIFGLPVIHSTLNVTGYVFARRRNDGCWMRSSADHDHEALGYANSMLVIRADGIRVIEENDRLWRVLKVSAMVGTDLRNNTRGFLTLKPLIPDKPKPKRKCETCKHGHVSPLDYPCRDCFHTHADKWEPEGKP